MLHKFKTSIRYDPTRLPHPGFCDIFRFVMTNNLSVSVIIPAYQRREMLRECLGSVRKQSIAPSEIIVIDDGSKPELRGIVSETTPSALYLYQENKGVSAARNAGIREARGSLLAFLDSDDLWYPEKLERQVEFFKNHPDALICQTEEIWIRNGGRINQMKKHKKQSGWIFRASLPLCIVSPSAVMIKRELFDKVGTFDESFPVCEDYELWLRIASRWPIYLINEPLVVKRGGHDDQLSRTLKGMDRYRILAIKHAIESGDLNEDNRHAAIEELQKKCGIYLKGCIKHKREEEIELFLQIAKRYESF